MSATVAADVAEYEYQLGQILGALEADPENDELLTLKNELNDLIIITKSRAQPQPGTALNSITTQNKLPEFTPSTKRKHEGTERRNVGDQVLAKWITGDHQFYVARITSITGNQADPVYTVKFAEYNETQTLHSHQLRSVDEYKVRALESAARSRTKTLAAPFPPSGNSTSIPPPPPSDGKESSVAQPKKKVSSLKDDLAQNATSWNSFARSGPKTTKKVGKRKAIGEGSMFRTEDGGRVGVIGSGRAMTSDSGKRGRHVFEPER